MAKNPRSKGTIRRKRGFPLMMIRGSRYCKMNDSRYLKKKLKQPTVDEAALEFTKRKFSTF
jgi:hypothetical protein